MKRDWSFFVIDVVLIGATGIMGIVLAVRMVTL